MTQLLPLEYNCMNVQHSTDSKGDEEKKVRETSLKRIRAGESRMGEADGAALSR